MNEDLNEGDQEVENEPVVHHFDGAGLGEALTHPHKHRGQHQHHLVQESSVWCLPDDSKHGVYRQVHGDHGLEEERLEVVGGVTDDVKEDGRHVDRHEGTFKDKLDHN